jgi:hypothetical protein
MPSDRPAIAPPTPRPDRRGRAQRWRDAVTVLLVLQAEYRAWLQALPDSLQESATAEALQAIDELDLDELQAIEPRKGFGRDWRNREHA